jgi:catechol 2,3-dioxygenase-like lactoylglutathione lyase family enzyme
MGESRGHWEGNTLVVETKNFIGGILSVQGNTPYSEDLVLTERFTRVAPDVIEYSVTVNDPKTYTRPWTATLPLRQEPGYEVYEYACHEGNYSMRNRLSAARKLEAKEAAAAKPVGQTKSLSHAIHAVKDLDTTLSFYRDVFGIVGKAQDFPNPGVPLLTNAPGVFLRLSMVALPGGTRFELTHFTGLERQAREAKYTDPGAASLVLYVSDLDSLVAAAKKAKATIVTTGGAPVEIATSEGRARSIVLRDPDGFFLQLVEGPAPKAAGGSSDAASAAPASRATAPTGAAGGIVHGVSLAFTMEDADATQRFYTGMMGIELAGAGAFKKDPALAALFGAPEDVEFRTLSGTLPPATAVTFTEFRGVPRTKFHLRVRDPGAPAMAIEVTNIEGMVAQMKAAGVNLISANGELVDFGNGVHNIFVEDPNGMNLELIERPAPR